MAGDEEDVRCCHPRRRDPARDAALAKLLRKADAIYLDEIRRRGLYDKIWQAFAVLLPVGVMGDARGYF